MIVNTACKCFHIKLKRSQTSVPLILCKVRRKRRALTSSLIGRVSHNSVSPIGHRSSQIRVFIKNCLSQKCRNDQESRTKRNRPCAADRLRRRDKCFHMSTTCPRRGADLSAIVFQTDRRPLQIIWKPGFTAPL